MLSFNALSQRAIWRWFVNICERLRWQRAQPQRIALATVIVWSAVLVWSTLAMSSTASASPVYPPRASCVLSATTDRQSDGQADSRSGTVLIRGSGFAPRQRVSLSVLRTKLTSPMSDADGGFSVREWLPAALRSTATLHAQSTGCATDVALKTTDAPTPPSLGQHPDYVEPSTAAPRMGVDLASTVPAGGLGGGLLLGITTLVIIFAVLFLLIAGHAGRRNPDPDEVGGP
jgi:hypothetical protein